MVGQLIYGEVSFDVLKIEPMSGRMLRLTLVAELPEKARDKIAILVQGTSREPVRVGYARDGFVVEVSLVY